MDVNGTRFHLLLGHDDWARCTDEDGRSLRDLWAGGLPPAEAPSVRWNYAQRELTLRDEVFEFTAGKLDRPPRLVDRRGAGRDAFGNWYWIGPDARTILVTSVGDGSTTQLWPGHGDCPPALPRLGTFGPVAPAPPPPADRFSGAAVTDDHFLVVGTLDPPGLLVFDLETRRAAAAAAVAGRRTSGRSTSPPGRAAGSSSSTAGRTSWPGSSTGTSTSCRPSRRPPALPRPSARPTAARRPPGRRSRPSRRRRSAATRSRSRRRPDGGFLVLDRNEAEGVSLVLQYADGAQVGAAARLEDLSLPLSVVGHDLAIVGGTLYVADAAGNQSYAFSVTLTPEGPAVQLLQQYFPMRLFGGKGLVASGGQACYDFGDRWIPLVEQLRPRYVESGTLVTPVLDGGEPGCVWHRLLLDACIPPGTSLAVWSRAADERGGARARRVAARARAAARAARAPSCRSSSWAPTRATSCSSRPRRAATCRCSSS